jgi:pilus assembly protein CpaF
VISNVAKDLKIDDAFFEPIYRYIEESSATELKWEKLGILIQ